MPEKDWTLLYLFAALMLTIISTAVGFVVNRHGAPEAPKGCVIQLEIKMSVDGGGGLDLGVAEYDQEATDLQKCMALFSAGNI